jgi:S-adenosylmethionine:tRNA ribosyltransferase-isomerase
MSRLVADYQFDLPPGRIATHPAEPRDSARLMVVDRASGTITHAHFRDLGQWITSEDLLVLNDTKVIPARLSAQNGAVEILLTQETSPRHWTAIGKPAKLLRAGARLRLDHPSGHPGAELEILKTLPDGQRVIRFFEDIRLEDYGQLPLPPYILKSRAEQQEPSYIASDNSDYQTVYARVAGSVAAPTAGLHFTPALLQSLPHAFLTLHVGLGTFRPVKVQDVADHDMHREHYFIPEGLAERARNARRVVAVGTTVCRVLETRPSLEAGAGETALLIYPPYRFRRTDALITNFHLPGSTLLMLVAAFMGLELQRRAYAEAIAQNYRFYSYGDAMLIL